MHGPPSYEYLTFSLLSLDALGVFGDEVASVDDKVVVLYVENKAVPRYHLS